jgi:hypothetical protein
MFEWLKQNRLKKTHYKLHRNILEEFDQEIKESGVDMNIENFLFVADTLDNADYFYVSRICDQDPTDFYAIYDFEMNEHKLEELIQNIDAKSNYVAVKIGGCLFVTRKSVWKKMQTGYNLY